MIDDVDLLSRYAAEQSEAAFAELSRRHVDLVYSTALRLVNGDVHAAQDVDVGDGFLAAADCCCEPVLNLAEVMDDPQVRARGMVVDLIHETWGAYRQMGIAPRLSSTPGRIRTHAPELGEHTDRLLSDLGYDSAEIERFRKEGVV